MRNIKFKAFKAIQSNSKHVFSRIFHYFENFLEPRYLNLTVYEFSKNINNYKKKVLKRGYMALLRVYRQIHPVALRV